MIGNDNAVFGQPFRVLVVYEDFHSLYRAFDICNLISFRLGPAYTLRISQWHFLELQDPSRQDRAAQEAQGAAMVIFATRGQGQLSPDLKRWVRRWVVHRGFGPPTRVGLLEAKGVTMPGRSAIYRFLKETAGRHRLHFFTGKEILDGSLFLSRGCGVAPAPSVPRGAHGNEGAERGAPFIRPQVEYAGSAALPEAALAN